MIGGRKDPTFLNYNPHLMGESTLYHESYAKWYIQTHFYICNVDRGDPEASKCYRAWIELKDWLPIMEPGYESNETYEKYRLV